MSPVITCVAIQCIMTQESVSRMEDAIAGGDGLVLMLSTKVNLQTEFMPTFVLHHAITHTIIETNYVQVITPMLKSQ